VSYPPIELLRTSRYMSVEPAAAGANNTAAKLQSSRVFTRFWFLRACPSNGIRVYRISNIESVSQSVFTPTLV